MSGVFAYQGSRCRCNGAGAHFFFIATKEYSVRTRWVLGDFVRARRRLAFRWQLQVYVYFAAATLLSISGVCAEIDWGWMSPFEHVI